MRFIATPEFLKTLSSMEKGSINNISATIKYIEDSDKNEITSKATTTEGSIYILRTGPFRIFFAFGNDPQGEYLLLLDIIQYAPHSYGTSLGARDPRTNLILNPNSNTSINPMVNTSLNPLINTSLNPFINTSLNPYINTSLNPLINTSLNHLINTSLNPLINTSLNPIINTSINPFINPNYAGPYIYDLGMKRTGYLVKANDRIFLIFNSPADFSGICVKNSSNGYTLFNKSNQWIGYLIFNRQDGYLYYDQNNKWIGIVV